MYAISGDSEVSNSAAPLALPGSSLITSIFMGTATQGILVLFWCDALLSWISEASLWSILQLELD